MVYYTISEMLTKHFNNDLGKVSATLDDNWGCLPVELENQLQAAMKMMKKIDNFNKYYGWVKRSCPDAQALATRLR